MNASLKVTCFLIFISLGACANRQKVLDSRVTFIDDHWLSSIELVSVHPVINKQGNLSVQVTGVNSSTSYESLEYRVEWISERGFLIPTILTRWTEFPSFESAEFTFIATSPTDKAASFKILIRTKK